MSNQNTNFYQIKYDKIKALRWPSLRKDCRLSRSVYYWFARDDNSVKASFNFEVLRSLSHNNEIIKNLSGSQINKLNKCNSSKVSNPNQEPAEDSFRHSTILHLFRQRTSTLYDLNPQDVIPGVFQDEKGNKFLMAFNEQTTNMKVVQDRFDCFIKKGQRLGLSHDVLLRALCSTEMFVVLASQIWETLGLKDEQYLLKLVEIAAMCTAFIDMAGLLHDPVFLIMSGYIPDKQQRDEFENMCEESKEFSYANQNLYFDMYFNEQHRPEYFPSAGHTEDIQQTLALYFNNSSVFSLTYADQAWRYLLLLPTRHFWSEEDKIMQHAIIHNRLLLDAYTLFTVRLPEWVMFDHGVVPNELGNIYIVFDGITPCHRTSFMVTHAASMANKYLSDVSEGKYEEFYDLSYLMKLINNFHIPGYFKEDE